jgi:hypothetical protein
MRRILCLLLLAPALTFAKEAKESLVPAKTGRVYKSVDSLAEVTVVELEPIKKGEVLLMVDHSNSAIDGLVLLHRTVIQGKAQAYVMDFEGDHTRMRAQDGHWFKQYALYLPESPTKEVQLYVDLNASRGLKPAKIVKAYQSQNQKAVNAKLEKAYNN